VDLRFPGFVANLKLDCMAETIQTELFKKSSLIWNRFLDSGPFNRYRWL